MTPPRVVQLDVTLLLEDGTERVALYITREKVDDMMTDTGTLGELLRDLADMEPNHIYGIQEPS